MCLERDVPDLAQLPAGGIDFAGPDRAATRGGYALTVARSPDWPDWLRLLLARRLTYGVARGYAIPREALDELAGHADPMIGLWAKCGLALDRGPRKPRSRHLSWPRAGRRARGTGDAITRHRSPRRGRAREAWDEVTLWMRNHHPGAAKIWGGWIHQE